MDHDSGHMSNGGTKRPRDCTRDDAEDNGCVPISKRINRLSLNSQMTAVCPTSSSGVSSAAAGTVPGQPALSMPVLVPQDPGQCRLLQLPPQPDLRPHESPDYYDVNCQLYRLHWERIRRRHY